jgi:hypothetical protein
VWLGIGEMKWKWRELNEWGSVEMKLLGRIEDLNFRTFEVKIRTIKQLNESVQLNYYQKTS